MYGKESENKFCPDCGSEIKKQEIVQESKYGWYDLTEDFDIDCDLMYTIYSEDSDDIPENRMLLCVNECDSPYKLNFDDGNVRPLPNFDAQIAGFKNEYKEVLEALDKKKIQWKIKTGIISHWM